MFCTRQIFRLLLIVSIRLLKLSKIVAQARLALQRLAAVDKVIFLCTGNSCRSQMAEGFARAFHGHTLQPFSAGTKPGVLNEYAVAVMAELGIDISKQYAKSLESLFGQVFEVAVIVCSSAAGECPHFTAPITIHQSFEDPPALALQCEAEEDKLKIYRRVRDEIAAFVQALPDEIKNRKKQNEQR